jgi:hypothetical protein
MIAILNIREKSMLLFFVERSFSCKNPGVFGVSERGEGEELRKTSSTAQRFFSLKHLTMGISKNNFQFVKILQTDNWISLFMHFFFCLIKHLL